MIYKIYIIDGNSGISILESSFKDFKNIDAGREIIPNFFKILNKTIDKIQEAVTKGGKAEEITRVIEAEDSTIMIYFHPSSRVLFCSISDADDDIDKLKNAIKKISSRFWRKHQSDIKIFRSTNKKGKFQAINADIENITMGGRIAEIFPKLLVVRKVLEKILSMGTISDFDFQIALQCNGKNSPLNISKTFEKTRFEIFEFLKKLERLDIIKI